MALAPGDRIKMIQAIGSGLMYDDLVDVDLTLGAFGAPAGEFEGYEHSDNHKYEYVLKRMAGAQDAAVTGLHAHLHEGAPTPEPTADPPAEGEPLVFISHTWKNRALAAEISSMFAELEIKGFVAHEHIEPTKDWATEIERNLHACSALVAVLTEDFPASPFCNQEIGYALGRGRLVVAVMQDQKPPPGLAAKYQAIPGSSGVWRAGRQIALNVLEVLLDQPMTRPLVVKSLALRYAGSYSFDDARANWARLQTIAADEWSEAMIEIAETSGRENGQLREGYATDPLTAAGRPIPELAKEHLDRLLDRKGDPAPPDLKGISAGGSEDDIPF